jgi:asparagine synthase (glutamine-hydrolysing)
MCGLLTYISATGIARTQSNAISEALESIHHRGPDGTGVHVDGDVVMGFKRLSIIDVEHSHQPLHYAGDRYSITFNGEIYNYLELRAELIQQGARFATHGDTEVIVAAYHYWGPEAVRKLRGMFAFVIWDRQERVAFGARDPFGIKPLFHLVTDHGVFFASEKKALLPFAKWGDGAMNMASLSHYLTLQYVPEPGTLHQDIGRIGSGECFTYRPGDGLATRRYWRAEFRPTPQDHPEELYKRIREVLRESVRIHMRSDVPVGAFLSSGIDSTAVVALAREFNPRILTFTAALEVDGYSELPVAQDSARHLGVTMHPVSVTAQMMMEALPRIVWHLDEPVADPALIPLYYVARKASEHVTVALSGEGSDEFFAGYRVYREPLSLRALSNLPSPMQRGLRAVSKAIPQGVKGKSFLERGTTPIESRYYGNARMYTEEEKSLLMRQYDSSVRYTDVTAPFYAEAAHLDDVEKMQYIDVYTWLRGDILVKADRMSMANSLEVRVPFLDYTVFDVAAGIPTDLKLPPRSTDTKYALRRALEGVVPPEIVNRVKLGFPTPIRVWLRGEMHDWAMDILGTSRAGHLIDLGLVRRLLHEHRLEQADHSRKIWTVLVFCLWYAIFVDGTLDPRPIPAESALLTKPVVGSMVH